jgi:hypothetical protein
MKREERLLEIRAEFQDFEKCLDEAKGNVAVAFDKWLEEDWRLLGVVEAIGYWVNMSWTEDKVREELKRIFQLIDKELSKIKNGGGGSDD